MNKQSIELTVDNEEQARAILEVLQIAERDGVLDFELDVIEVHDIG